MFASIVEYVSFVALLINNDLENVDADQTTLFEMVNEIVWNITTHQELIMKEPIFQQQVYPTMDQELHSL